MENDAIMFSQCCPGLGLLQLCGHVEETAHRAYAVTKHVPSMKAIQEVEEIWKQHHKHAMISYDCI